MHQITRGIIAVIAAAAVALSASPAQATSSTSDNWDFAFGFFSDQTYEEVFEEIIEMEGPERTADFFSKVSGDQLQAVLPTLEGLDEKDIKSVIAASEQAARKGTALDVKSLPSEILPDITIAPMSISTAPTAGWPTNSSYSWQNKVRYNYAECTRGVCTVKSWIEIRITSDPGERNTTHSLNFTTWGNQLNRVTLTASIYLDSRLGDISTHTWNAPGSAIQRNRHSSTQNKPVRFLYLLKIPVPGGKAATAEYKSKFSNRCREVSPGAFKCLFPY